MNAKHLCTLVVSASLSLLTAAGAEDYPSIEKAMVGFATNAVAVQERAYRYVQGKAKTMNGKNVKLVLQSLKTMSAALKRAAEYDEACAAGMTSDSESVRFACASALLQSSSTTNCAKAVRQVEEVVEREGGFLPEHRMELIRAVADVRQQKLADAKGAAEGVDRAILRAGDDKASVFQLRLKKIDLFRAAKMDDELEKEVRQILSDATCPPQTYQAAAYALVDLEVARTDFKAAGEILLGVIKKVNPVPTGIAKRLVEAKADEATLEVAISMMRRKLAEMPLDDAGVFKAAAERVQVEVVEILNHIGRCNEALAECRVLVLLSSAKSYQAAVNQTAITLKRADGNLGRAMSFMEFQKKDVIPKRRNILLDAPRLSDAVRAEARTSLPVGKSELWSESLAVSARLIWLDDPLAAVQEAMHAFALAPFDRKSLQVCADAVMQPILTLTRDPDSVKGIVDYLMYGPNGPDGAKGTQDDLPSPFESLSSVLKFGCGN